MSDLINKTMVRRQNMLIIASIVAVGTIAAVSAVDAFYPSCNEYTCPDTWWMPMTDDDKIDYIVNKTGSSADDARAAYTKTQGDVLESIEILGMKSDLQP